MAVTTMAIVVVVPGAAGQRLRRLQRRLAPEADGAIPPYITLVGPFDRRAPFPPLEQHCWRAGHETSPFDVELGDLTVDDRERLAYAEVVSGGERLRALREALLAGEDAPAAAALAAQPRCTVALLERPEDVAFARRETAGVRGGAFFLERFELLACYPDGSWYERDFYTLDRASLRAR